jgi:hypothetical protein
MNRQSEIVELDEDTEQEIDPRELIRDELFENFKIALIDEKRLLKRFYDFCIAYNDFEYDEMGMNMEESEDISRKIIKIRDKFLDNVMENISSSFEHIDMDILNKSVWFDIKTEQYSYKIMIKILNDSFELEIK